MKKVPWEIKGVVNQVVLDLFEGQMKKEMWQQIQINQGLKNNKCVFLYWKLSQSLFSLSPSRWRHSSFNNWKPDKCHRGRIYFNSSTHPKISKYRTDASVLTRNPLTSYLWPNKKKWWMIFWDKSWKIIRDRMKLKWEENFYSELHFFFRHLKVIVFWNIPPHFQIKNQDLNICDFDLKFSILRGELLF